MNAADRIARAMAAAQSDPLPLPRRERMQGTGRPEDDDSFVTPRRARIIRGLIEQEARDRKELGE